MGDVNYTGRVGDEKKEELVVEEDKIVKKRTKRKTGDK